MNGCLAPAVCLGQEIPTALVGDRAEAARLAEVITACARREADAKGEAAGEIHFGRVVGFRGGRPIGVARDPAGDGLTRLPRRERGAGDVQALTPPAARAAGPGNEASAGPAAFAQSPSHPIGSMADF